MAVAVAVRAVALVVQAQAADSVEAVEAVAVVPPVHSAVQEARHGVDVSRNVRSVTNTRQ